MALGTDLLSRAWVGQEIQSRGDRSVIPGSEGVLVTEVPRILAPLGEEGRREACGLFPPGEWRLPRQRREGCQEEAKRGFVALKASNSYILIPSNLVRGFT